jgi:hypothetical protein
MESTHVSDAYVRIGVRTEGISVLEKVTVDLIHMYP